MSGRLDSALSRLLFALVPIAVQGPEGAGVGTAFLFTSPHAGGEIPVLVANRSLVERAEHGRLFFTRAEAGRAVVGDHLAFDLDGFASLWHPHPDPRVDLAVAPFGPIPSQLAKAGREAHVSSLDRSLIPSVEDPEVDVIEEVLVLGFVAGLQDPAHILPLTQRGLTASPFQVDYDRQSAFVVQVPVYPGLGGSPVIQIERETRPASGSLDRTTQIRLLGVLSRVAEWKDDGFEFVAIPPAPPPAGASWASFALAIRAERISEAVDDLVRTRSVAG